MIGEAEMKKTKVEINSDNFPEEIRDLLKDATVYDSSCHSSAKVYYIDSGYYVKIDDLHTLKSEAELSKLFYERGLGVEVVYNISSDKDYLVTRGAIGEDLTHYLQDPVKLCELLAVSLHKLHAQSIENAPVSSRYQRYMDSANGDYDGGYYDESVLLNRYMVHSKEEAWEIMQANKDKLVADTLIHGDACLPNIIQEKGRFTSFIDFNMAGVWDKHIDIYWAIKSLQINLKTEDYTDLFLDMYGRDNINEERLRVIAAYELFG